MGFAEHHMLRKVWQSDAHERERLLSSVIRLMVRCLLLVQTECMALPSSSPHLWPCHTLHDNHPACCSMLQQSMCPARKELVAAYQHSRLYSKLLAVILGAQNCMQQGLAEEFVLICRYSPVDVVACQVVSCSICKGGCCENACHYSLGTGQVGEPMGLHVQAQILLYSLTEEHSIGSAMAALLKGPASQALLSALEDAVTHYRSTPVAQVRTQCNLLPGYDDPEGAAPVLSAPPLESSAILR